MADVFNDLVLNSEGIYKGGASDNTGYPEGGKIRIKVFSVNESDEETLLGSISTPAMADPGSGMKWYWRIRAWAEKLGG